jgi:hypothetical protein
MTKIMPCLNKGSRMAQFKGLNLTFLKDIIIIFYSATSKATTKRWDLMKTRDD